MILGVEFENPLRMRSKRFSIGGRSVVVFRMKIDSRGRYVAAIGTSEID